MGKPKFAPGSVAVFTVKNRSGKKPLVGYLASRLGVVEAWAEGLLADGRVTLDDQPATPACRINLSAGPHRIEVKFPPAWPRHMAATEMPLDILHEDADLIVLNKPPGRVVHPARGHLDNQTLQNGVRHRYRDLIGREDATIGPPHRLDKDTSGAVVFALFRSAYSDLVEQFSSGAPHKEYLAILDGNPDFDRVVCDQPLGPDADRHGRGTVLPVERGGKTACTEFAILERGEGWALARAVPRTGRAHQIRIHAAFLGLPLAGDRDYNPNPDRLGATRQALHAVCLSFTHPRSRDRVRIEAPLAGDMRLCLERLRRDRGPRAGG